jgi:hypothetical protein
LSYFALIKKPKTFIKSLCNKDYLQLKPCSVQLALYVLYCLLSPMPTGLSPVLIGGIIGYFLEERGECVRMVALNRRFSVAVLV